MKYLLFSGLLLTGCASSNQLPRQEANPLPAQVDSIPEHLTETPECKGYRGMMTAPMPPQEVEKLKQACESSRK